MTDYKVNYDVQYFGTDNPATAVAERMPFVVQTNGKDKFVNIGIVSGQHGSHVAGIAAGNSLFGGAMSGAAPGAKIVSLRACLFVAGCTAHALLDGMIYVAKQSNVDVINMSIGGLPSLNDGNNARCIVYTRLIEQSNVQMFISAGNSGSGMNTVGDPSVCGKVMSVGSYITKDSWQKNYGSDSAFADNLHGFSSRGPREDGGFKPSFVAPGSAISTTPLWQPGGPVGGTYALPPGYSMLNGTSMASPQAAGAAALLISAAKQQNVQKQPDQLRQALTSSARLLDTSRIGVYEQGNGLINVGAAWNLLKTNIKTVDISSSVPVNTLLSGLPRDAGHRSRHPRPRGRHPRPELHAHVYVHAQLRWRRGGHVQRLVGRQRRHLLVGGLDLAGEGRGDDVRRDRQPVQRGAHSAILNLDDPSTAGIDYQTMNTVVVPEVFTAAGNYTVTKSGTIGRNQTKSFFFRVPANTPAFKVDFAGPSATPGTGQARFLRFHPYGVGIDSNAEQQLLQPARSGGVPGVQPEQPDDDEPDRRRLGGHGRGAAHVGRGGRPVHADGVDPRRDGLAEPGRDRVRDDRRAGRPLVHADEHVRRLHGPCRRHGVSAAPSMATPTIANLAQQQYPVNVTAGSTSLRATIGSPSDPAADLDLFVFNCTTGTCVLAGQNADGDSEESVTIANPAAGTWLVLVDGFAVPAGTTTYKYVDVFANAAFGSVAVTDANALRPSGCVVDRAGLGDRECGAGEPAACSSGTSRCARTRTCSSARAT